MFSYSRTNCWKEDCQSNEINIYLTKGSPDTDLSMMSLPRRNSVSSLLLLKVRKYDTA